MAARTKRKVTPKYKTKYKHPVVQQIGRCNRYFLTSPIHKNTRQFPGPCSTG